MCLVRWRRCAGLHKLRTSSAAPILAAAANANDFNYSNGARMPQWVRHTSQTITRAGFWTTSAPVIVDNCTPSEQQSLEAQFNALKANPGINAFPALRDAMIPLWGGMRIDCCFDASRPPRTDTIEGRIFICWMNALQQQQEICKGLVEEIMAPSPAPAPQPLEARAMLFACFGAPIGIPNAVEFAMMAALPQLGNNAMEREGRFLIWNRSTGEVFNKATTTTGGFWTGSTTVSKGTRGFIDSGWVG
jgi:hypothetical protein